MRINNKALYEQIMRNISREVKRALNESSDMSDMYDDIYQELVDASQEIPEISVQKSDDKRYVAMIFFKDYYYRLLDRMIDINSQGETWINISPTLSATIVAIGSSSGKRYSKPYGKFRSIQQLVTRLEKDIENERPNMPINTYTVQASKAARQMARRLATRSLNIELPPMSRNAQESYMTTFTPLFRISDTIEKNIDNNYGNPYCFYLTKHKKWSKNGVTNQKDIINDVSKQIEYDLNSDEEISVNVRFGVSYNYSEPEYDQKGLKQLGNAVKKYLIMNYKNRNMDINDEGYEFTISLYGESQNVLELIETALNIVDSYEQFINEHIDEYINF